MTREEWKKGWKELWIRFNTSPKLYQKSDFGLLLQLLKHIWDWSSSSKPVEIETEGKGNVITDIAVKEDNVLTVTKGEIEPGGGGGKTYFPDFAFWQKPCAKKGALVLIAKRNLSDLGYTKSYKDFLILVGTTDNLNISGGKKSDNVELSFDANFKTLINRVRYLVEHEIIGLLEDVLIKFGCFNSVHYRGDDETQFEIFIHGKTYDFLTCNIYKDHRSIESIEYTDMDIYVPASDILTWEDIEYCHINMNSSELYTKFYSSARNSCRNIYIFTNIDSYKFNFNLDYFYTLQYYKKDDEWKAIKISNKEVSVKYHKTKAILTSDDILRSTYREYYNPSVTIYTGKENVQIDGRKYITSDWIGLALLFKRFVKKGTPKFKQHFYHFKFIETPPSGDSNFFRISNGAWANSNHRSSGKLYMILGYCNRKYAKERKKKPCNEYEFLLRNREKLTLMWHRENQPKKYFLNKIVLLRLYVNYDNELRFKFHDYLIPKIVY